MQVIIKTDDHRWTAPQNVGLPSATRLGEHRGPAQTHLPGNCLQDVTWVGCLIKWCSRPAALHSCCLPHSARRTVGEQSCSAQNVSCSLDRPDSTRRATYPTLAPTALDPFPSWARISSTCSPYFWALVGPSPWILINSAEVRGLASASAISVASVKTQKAGKP